MNVAVTDGQQAVTTPMNSISHPVRADGMERNKTTLCYLGVTEIILGVISCVLGVIAFGFIMGIWNGLILIISGILGVTARCHPTKPVYTANIVLSIFAVLAMVALLLLSSVVAAVSVRVVSCVILAVTAFAAVIITIIHCSYSCIVNSTKRRRDGRVMYRPVPQQQLIPVQMPNGQIMYYPSQMITSPNFYPSNVQTTMVPIPISPANSNQPMHPTQPIYSTPTQSGQSPFFQTSNNPLAYYPPTVPTSQPVCYASPHGRTTPNYSPGLIKPTSAAIPAQPSQQIPFFQHTQQSSPLAETSSNPRLYGDRKQTE